MPIDIEFNRNIFKDFELYDKLIFLNGRIGVIMKVSVKIWYRNIPLQYNDYSNDTITVQWFDIDFVWHELGRKTLL